MNNYFWVGVVEDRMDPLFLGRCKVRIFGVHTSDAFELPSQDLPWAVSVTPSTSASMNGVGTAPVGPVPGTTVVGFFLDYPDTQMPAFIGSISGIPQAEQAPDDPNQLVYVFDKIDDEPDYINPSFPEEFVPLDSPFTSLSPFQMVCDEDGIRLVKSQTILYEEAHWDGRQWILGYGQAIIDGKPVSKGQLISEVEAERNIREYIQNNIEPKVRQKVKIDVTQSMFNTFCALEFIGTNDRVYRLTNDRKFNQVRQYLIQEENPSLVRAFSREGDPKPDGSSTLAISQIDDSFQQDGGVIRGRNPDPVVAFHQFGQVSAEWPRKLHLNEPDTNRLARGHNIRRTIVYQKEQELEQNIKLPNTDIQWSHPPIPYNAQYPYNRVIETEGGHVIEIDDTPGSERINVHHKAGTFIEIDANGTRVARTKGDVYEIMERNGFVHVKGHVIVNVEGGTSIQVAGNADLHVGQNLYATVGNDVKLTAGGDMDFVVQDFQMNAKSIKMKADSGIDFQISSGNFQVDGDQVWLNSKKSTSTNITSIADHRTDLEQLEEALTPLEVPLRMSEEMTFVEFPEEDAAATQHRQDMLKRGIISPDDLVDRPIEMGPVVSGGQGPTDLAPALIGNPQNVPTTRISRYFTLGDLTQSTTIQNKQNPVIAIHRLSVEQIIENLSLLATNCLDTLAENFSFNIVSGLRHPSQRYSIPGRNISRHEIGLAADLQMIGKSKQEVVQICREITTLIPFDTILLEYSPRGNYWVHVQLTDGPLRRRTMTARQTGNRTQILSSTGFVVA